MDPGSKSRDDIGGDGRAARHPPHSFPRPSGGTPREPGSLSMREGSRITAAPFPGKRMIGNCQYASAETPALGDGLGRGRRGWFIAPYLTAATCFGRCQHPHLSSRHLLPGSMARQTRTVRGCRWMDPGSKSRDDIGDDRRAVRHHPHSFPRPSGGWPPVPLLPASPPPPAEAGPPARGRWRRPRLNLHGPRSLCSGRAA